MASEVERDEQRLKAIYLRRGVPWIMRVLIRLEAQPKPKAAPAKARL